MGARFSQFFVDMPVGAVGSRPVAGVERFLMVLDGSVTLKVNGQSFELAPEGYALVPSDLDHEVVATTENRLIVLERTYTPLANIAPPELVTGRVQDQPGTRVDGGDTLTVRRLVPEEPGFDCQVNVMDFTPGASLPYVETHFMEHGLLMLSGGGVYRLDDEWYPVDAGDVIWMGPFCPQWFGAIGQNNARYLIYKNWNRDPLVS